MLTSQLRELASKPDDETYLKQVQLIFQQLTSKLLNSQRFYGELLLRLDKRIDCHSPSALRLETGDKLMLVINPDQLGQVANTDEQLIAMVQHVVGHLAWQHPARYQQDGADPLVQIATDMVVNEQLKASYPGAITRAEVNFKLHLNLPAGLSSAQYLSRLRRAVKDDPSGQRASQVKAMRDQSPEAHTGWQKLSQATLLQSQTLVDDAWAGTPAKQRGLLPSRLQHQLSRQPATLDLDWRQLVMLGLNGPQQRQQPAYNRFNRRQPYRLELPGITRATTRQIDVFVDESGSMSDTEVQFILAQVAQLLRRYRDSVQIVPFDAVVHEDQLQHISNSSQLHFTRVAGGGTSYQAIFDWLKVQGANDLNTVALILTDGHGEHHLQTYGFTNVVWGLTTTQDDLSVDKPVGHVTVIQERK